MVLGIESTAHTFSVGWVDPAGEPGRAVSAFVRPVEGGIHPREAADHHVAHAGDLLRQLRAERGVDFSEVRAIAFSQGPGLGPCLRVGASVARALATRLDVPLVGVNHCVAHIEIGRQQCGCEGPVLLYVSGGNTQVIARLQGRYRVLGETLDIGIGNMLDKFARGVGIPFPGGPHIEQLALVWIERGPGALDDLALPYAVQGMDLAFSGLLTATEALLAKGAPLPAVCWSLQEHAFAACVEVAERALAHTGKDEVLLGGGVACNERLRQMSAGMAAARGATSHVPARHFCVDNGSMIALLGRRQLESAGPTPITASAVQQALRTDQTPITWA